MMVPITISIEKSKCYRTFFGRVLKYDGEATKDVKERTKDFFDRFLF